MRKIKTPIIIVPFSSPGDLGGSTPPDNGD